MIAFVATIPLTNRRHSHARAHPHPHTSPARRKPLVCSSTKPKKKSKVIELTDVEAKAWGEVRTQLLELGVPTKSADKIITRAFGWGKQKYWRGTIVREMPSSEVVEERMTYLRSLGISDDEVLAKMVAKFPELIRLDIERMNESIAQIESYPAYSKPDALRRCIINQPQALGFDVDCGGDCAGECQRCWIRLD